jgi:integrase
LLQSAPIIERLSEKGNVRKGFVRRADLDRIIANLPEYLADPTLFAFLSSWRRGEILSITWPDVDSDTIRLRAEHSKEGEARSLALEGELAELIHRRRACQYGPLVFHHDGHPITDMRKSWTKACRMAGVPDRLFHDLRRSGVRDMIRAGMPPHVAMSISGHKTDSMLRRYAIISEADQRAALRRTQEFRSAETNSSPTSGNQVIQ